MAHQARKRFGQHFLTDSNYINAIIAAIRPQSGDRVVEIGPGLGAMTMPLLNQLNQLDVVEIDRDLVLYWTKKNISNLQIHQADALKFDFRQWALEAKTDIANKKVAGSVKIVGNLPYNISSPLLFHLINAIDHVDEQIFMLQLEVVQRMVAAPGSSDYSRLSVMLQAKYHMENKIDIPPEAFDPPPKVDSAVVEMLPRRDIQIAEDVWKNLEKIVAASFAQRRKMLGNNLKDYKDKLNLDAEILKSRAQDIPVDVYIDWARTLTV